ncbi:MAG TPA: metallophosphoesterase, partial [Cytophagaceae bacterium]
IPELAQDLKDCFQEACALAIKLKVKYLFIVGDLFDHNRPSPDLIDFVAKQVRVLNMNGIIVAGIAGDHDKPVNNTAWIHLTGVIPINHIQDCRKFVGFDYTDNSQENVNKLQTLDYASEVEWIFLHGQTPELFTFCDDKKRLDFRQIDLLNLFPRLKGIILGDIHNPVEGTITDPAMKREEPYIGYCGSLGVVKLPEINNKTGVLHYDGKKLQRVPFELPRQIIKVYINDLLGPINLVNKYTNFFKDNKGKKPLFVVEYDKSSKDKLPQLGPLYDVGIVKTIVVNSNSEEEEEVVNIRSELKTKDRIETALRESTEDEVVIKLIQQLIDNPDDFKSVLDNYKKEKLG